MPKDRKLLIMTREGGVREENPLLRIKDKYYPDSKLRSEFRPEADELLRKQAEDDAEAKKNRKLGMTVVGRSSATNPQIGDLQKRMQDKYLKSKGY